MLFRSNDSAAVIKLIGLTISGGKDQDDMSTGSGIYTSYADSLILDRMIVKDNESSQYGGGIYCRNTNYLSIGNSWIYNNNSKYGGGGVSDREQHRRAQRTFLVLLREFFATVMPHLFRICSTVQKWSQNALLPDSAASKDMCRVARLFSSHVASVTFLRISG